MGNAPFLSQSSHSRISKHLARFFAPDATTDPTKPGQKSRVATLLYQQLGAYVMWTGSTPTPSEAVGMPDLFAHCGEEPIRLQVDDLKRVLEQMQRASSDEQIDCYESAVAKNLVARAGLLIDLRKIKPELYLLANDKGVKGNDCTNISASTSAVNGVITTTSASLTAPQMPTRDSSGADAVSATGSAREFMQHLMAPPDLAIGKSNACDLIVEDIWLGDQDSAKQAIARGFRSIVCCIDVLKEPTPGAYAKHDIDVHHIKGFHDGHGPKCTIFGHVESGAKFIHTQISSGRTPILVHCSAGKSRSPSTVIAFLMMYRKKTLRDAMHLTRSKRHMAYPILPFWHELAKLETDLSGKPPSLDMGLVTALHSQTVGQKASAAPGVTAWKVDQLRVVSCKGESVCRAALQKTQGDMDKAMVLLLS